MLNQSYHHDVALSFIDPDHRPKRFIVVVPLLSEVERIGTSCPDLRFKDPQPIHGQKLYHLEKLIEDGENIATTHALFQLLNRSMYERLKQRGYTLVIDEVLNCVEMFSGLTKADRTILFNQDMVFVDPNNKRLCWNYSKHAAYPPDGRFGGIKKLCDIGSLVVVSDTIMLWEFPSEFLRCFNEVIVCTYMFHGSVFSAYLAAEGFAITMKSVANGKLAEWTPTGDHAQKALMRSLITIYEGPMNRIGDKQGRQNPLSSTWFKNARSDVLRRLKSSCETFFGRIAKTQSQFNAWTAFGDHKKSLAGKGYARGWIPNNAKATNDFRHKASMAYLCNWYCHPVIKRYFEERGVPIREDMYALSAMLQWIWRSRIRDGMPIHLFIPSERMRRLLKDWLAGREIGREQGFPELKAA